MEKDLVPAGDRPAAVIGVWDPLFIEFTHEALDVVSAEAEMPARHRVDVLLHLEARIYIPFGPMKFNGAITQEVDVAVVTRRFALVVNPCVFGIVDRPEVEELLIKLGQLGQTICA